MLVASPMLNNKFIRYIAIFLAIIGISIASLNLDPYAEKISQIATYQLRPFGVELNFQSPTLSFTSISSQKIEIGFPENSFSFVVNSPQFNISLLDFILLHPSATLSGEAYGGPITIYGRGNLSQNALKVLLNANNIDLGQHPNFRALSLEGKLSANDSWIDITSPGIRSGQFHIAIKEGAKPIATKVSLAPLGAPFTVTVPSIPKIELGIDGELENKIIKNLEIVLISSLANINATGEIKLSYRDRIENVSIIATVALTDLGKSELGTMLNLASAGLVKIGATEFKVDIQGNPIRPSVIYSDVQ